MVENLLACAEDIRDEGSIPGLGRSPGGGHGNPLQYSCLENPMDRGAWATLHGVSKSQTQLSVHPHTHSTHTQVKCQVLASQLNEKRGFYILTKKMKPWRKSFPHLQCWSVDCGSDSISPLLLNYQSESRLEKDLRTALAELNVCVSATGGPGFPLVTAHVLCIPSVQWKRINICSPPPKKKH